MSDAVLTWVASVTGTAVARAVPLEGGTHAATFLISPHDLVLRLFGPGDPAAGREERILTLLDGLDGFVPRPVAADPDGSAAGVPAALISRLDGRAGITPADPARAARELAVALARIHAIATPPDAGLRDLLALAAERRPALDELLPALAGDQVLSHSDFWSGNALWDGDRLTAVVDWDGAGLAPRGFDVGWCRFDLFLLHGRETADLFLTAYEQAAGVEIPPLWDRFTALRSADGVADWTGNYAPLGRPDLTEEELRRLHTLWAAGQ